MHRAISEGFGCWRKQRGIVAVSLKTVRVPELHHKATTSGLNHTDLPTHSFMTFTLVLAGFLLICSLGTQQAQLYRRHIQFHVDLKILLTYYVEYGSFSNQDI